MIDKFFRIIETKTEQGIKKLEGLDIGTEEYKELVTQIISNLNLIKDKGVLKGEAPTEKPKQFDPQSVIGKEFK